MKRHAWAVLLLGCWWLGAVRADVDADIKGLKSQDANLRKQSAARLTQAGKAALPKLKEVVNKDGEKQYQITVLQTLAEIGPDPDKDLRQQLVAMVKSKPDLRNEAARVLGRMGSAEP